ncbi:unnamed protein product [Parajaminaea phylloscopi]
MLFTRPSRAVSAGLALLAAALPTATACPGLDHEHGLTPRSSRYATQPSPGTALLRKLTWGDVNIVHTTDIHGWYQGHLHSAEPEPNYSGDFGDFYSFVSHLRTQAKRRGVDLLVVDSGDLHDGAGLSDGFPEGQVDGHVSNQFHSMVRYDLLSVGNHELYKYGVAYDVYRNFIPAQKGRYLASNVNISIYDDKLGRNVSRVMGERYVKYRTAMGRKVTSLGVIFNFKGQDKGLTVQDPKDMVKEAWFAQAIKERPDLFLLAGHMPVSKDEWPVVIAAIRKLHPTTPIMVLGGHTHIRDCTTYDQHSVGLESGRYLETIGWLSANLSAPSAANLSFSRTYIDANRRNYAFHLGLSETKQLDTGKGKHITNAMAKVASDWNLTEVYGKAPQSYYLDRVGVESNTSLLHFLASDVLPTVISTSNPDRKHVPNFVVANSGAQRFDLYAGDFTKNDQFIVSPFTDAFLYFKDVPYGDARRVVGQLNKQGAYARRQTDEEMNASLRREKETYERGEVDHIYKRWRRAQHLEASARRDLEELDARADAIKTLGYVTKDSCPGQGDDTQHVAIPYASTPDYVASPVAGNSSALQDSDKVDLIVVDFVATAAAAVLNKLQTERNYTAADAVPYNSLTTQDLYPLYAKQHWN